MLVDSPHERAWRESLRELMETEWSDIRDQTTWTPEAFTPQVYQQEMSGKPRMSGALAAIEYFHVPDAETTTRRVRRAQAGDGGRLIKAGEFTAYPGRAALHPRRQDAGIRVAAASSSKNAELFLSRSGSTPSPSSRDLLGDVRPGLTLLDFFDADVSGRDFAHGKPTRRSS